MNMSGATQRPGTGAYRASALCCGSGGEQGVMLLGLAYALAAPGKLGSRPHTPMSHLEDILGE
jgi:hypothetical protein